MTPNQPYLIRAYYEWILDNEFTPHLAVDAQVEGVDVPREHVKDGQIILNVSPTACVDLQMGNEWIMFNARFGGVSRRLVIPVTAVLAIFARENGAGTMFMPQDGSETPQDAQQSNELGSQEQPEGQVEQQKSTGANLQSIESSELAEDAPEAEKPPRPKGKPSLKVIK